jgi:hypothetical protein
MKFPLREYVKLILTSASRLAISTGGDVVFEIQNAPFKEESLFEKVR